MRRIVLVVLGLMVAAALPVLATAPAHAAYKTSCEPGSGSYSGRCHQQRSAVVKKSTIVDAVPLQNHSSKTVTMNCSFSSTVTRSVTVGGSASVTASAEASFAVIAKASVSATYTIRTDVSMTASQAKSAGGSVTLKPGESITCQRIYSYVQFSSRSYTYSGSKVTYGATKTVTVPSSLGVRMVD